LQEINNAKNKDELEKVGMRIRTGINVKKFNDNQVKVLKEVWTGKAQGLAFKK